MRKCTGNQCNCFSFNYLDTLPSLCAVFCALAQLSCLVVAWRNGFISRYVRHLQGVVLHASATVRRTVNVDVQSASLRRPPVVGSPRFSTPQYI